MWREEFLDNPVHSAHGFRCKNVLVGEVSDEDIKLFFGDDNCDFIKVENATWPDVLVAAEMFPSKGQARKNGWNKELTAGWHEAIFKKKKVIVFVFVDQNSIKRK